MAIPVAMLTASLAIHGCGDDAGVETEEPLPDCGLEMELSGGATGSYTIGGTSWACGIPFASGAGIQMIFIAANGDVGGIEIGIDAITKGATGTFTADVRITSEDGAQAWSTDAAACEVAVTEHDLIGGDEMTDEYLVVGTGSCTAAAALLEGNGGAPITLGDFRFRFPARWTKGS